MQRLTGVEADRVISVLNEALERSYVLAHLPPPETPDLELVAALEDAGNAELAAALSTQWQVEESAAVMSRPGSGRGGRKTELAGRPTTPAAARASSQAKKSAQNLCRLLKADPRAAAALRERHDPSDAMSGLLEALEELKKLTFTKLAQTHEEARSMEGHADLLASRHQENMEAKSELEAELFVQRRKFEAEAETLATVQSKLQAEVDDRTATLAAETEELERTVKRVRTQAEEKHEARMTFLEAEVEKLTKDLDEVHTTSKDAEKTLKKNKGKKRVEMQTIINNYDTKLHKLDADMTELREVYRVETERLAKLTYHFDRMEADKHRADEEDRLWREERRASLDFKMANWNRDTTRIQSAWRGFFTRKHISDFLPKKKKGKGKKGKKK